MRPAARAIEHDSVVACIVDTIRAHCEPEQVVLFGSRASGRSRPDSDYDLLIVLPGAQAETTMLARELRQAFQERDIPADVHVRSSADYARWRDDPGFIDYVVTREGRVIFGTPDRAPRRIRENAPSEGVMLWRRRANNDLRVAEQSWAAPDPVPDGICFHAHASVEKLLKSMIVARGVVPPRTHDLLLLLKELTPLRIEASVLDACRLLMTLYPRSRYPELAEASLEDARAALSSAHAVHAVLGECQ
jgi:uncharacterized protein